MRIGKLAFNKDSDSQACNSNGNQYYDDEINPEHILFFDD
jgi:hypothetical protein